MVLAVDEWIVVVVVVGKDFVVLVIVVVDGVIVVTLVRKAMARTMELVLMPVMII